MMKVLSKFNKLSRINKILIVSGIFATIAVYKLHTSNFVNEFLFVWGMSFAMINLIIDSKKVDSNVGKAVCEKIIVETKFDDQFYPDYLEQFKDSKNPEEQKYYTEDKKRLEDFNNNKWYAVGIKAVAVVRINFGNGPSIIQYIKSGGLWGIESDSEPSHFKDIKKEQIEEVKNYLKILNVEKINEAPIEYKEELF